MNVIKEGAVTLIISHGGLADRRNSGAELSGQ